MSCEVQTRSGTAVELRGVYSIEISRVWAIPYLLYSLLRTIPNLGSEGDDFQGLDSHIEGVNRGSFSPVRSLRFVYQSSSNRARARAQETCVLL